MNTNPGKPCSAFSAAFLSKLCGERLLFSWDKNSSEGGRAASSALIFVQKISAMTQEFTYPNNFVIPSLNPGTGGIRLKTKYPSLGKS